MTVAKTDPATTSATSNTDSKRILDSSIPEEKAQVLLWETLGLPFEFQNRDWDTLWITFGAHVSPRHDGEGGHPFFRYRLKPRK